MWIAIYSIGDGIENNSELWVIITLNLQSLSQSNSFPFFFDTSRIDLAPRVSRVYYCSEKGLYRIFVISREDMSMALMIQAMELL